MAAPALTIKILGGWQHAVWRTVRRGRTGAMGPTARLAEVQGRVGTTRRTRP